MALHIIAGSGPVGTAVAAELLDRGDQVRVVTRSGTGPDGVEKVALDVTDRDAFAAQCADAAVIYNCVNPPYDQWPATWPPIAESLLHAAERSGAVLAITGGTELQALFNGTYLGGYAAALASAFIWATYSLMTQRVAPQQHSLF